MLHPLMAGAASPAEAAAVVAQLGRIEAPYGIAACEPGERDQLYQWDHPNGWPPSQFAAVTGLLNYGYREKALQLLRAYLNTIERNFQTSGRLWEKYNVVSGNLEVADEYPMPTFLGWTAGVYLWGAQLLNAS
jgi:alpha,alpha-trehalase